MTKLWDPLTYENLMAGTVAHFEKQRLQPLMAGDAIEGPGIYALYYQGEFPEYRPIADSICPIYVGKAVPPWREERGRRVGRCGPGAATQARGPRQID